MRWNRLLAEAKHPNICFASFYLGYIPLYDFIQGGTINARISYRSKW